MYASKKEVTIFLERAIQFLCTEQGDYSEQQLERDLYPHFTRVHHALFIPTNNHSSTHYTRKHSLFSRFSGKEYKFYLRSYGADFKLMSNLDEEKTRTSFYGAYSLGRFIDQNDQLSENLFLVHIYTKMDRSTLYNLCKQKGLLENSGSIRMELLSENGNDRVNLCLRRENICYMLEERL